MMLLLADISSLFDNQTISIAPSPFFWVLLPAYVSMVLIGLFAGAILLYRFVSGKITLTNSQEWLNTIPWTLKNAIPIFLIIITTQTIFILSIRLLRNFHLLPTSKEMIALLTSLHGIVFHIFAICLVYIFCRKRLWQLSVAFGLSLRNFLINFGRALLVYTISLPCVIGLSIIINFIMLLQGKEMGLQEVIFVFSTPASFLNLIFLVLLAVVFAPIAEEMLFRGILLPILAKKIGVAASVIITSAIFSAIHMHLPSFLPLFALSLALAISYLYWRNLLIPIFIHAIFNLISTSLVLASNLLPK